MVVATFQSPEFTDPQTSWGVEAAANYLNSHGGLDGYHVSVETCNDAVNPNNATECAEQAVQDQVVALVPVSVYGDKMYPITDAAHIPNVGTDGIVPQDNTDTYSWPVEGGVNASFAGEGLLAGRLGCTGIGFIADNGAAFQVAASDVQAGATQAGIKFAVDYVTPPIEDYSTAVAQVTSNGINCVGADTNQSDLPKIQAAVAQSGKSLKLVLANAFALPSVLREMGSAANGIEVANVTAPIPGNSSDPSTNPTISAYLSQMHAFNPTLAPDSNAVVGWGAMQLLKTAVNGLGTLTASTAQAALQKLSNYNPGFSPSFDFQQSGSVTGQPRLFSTQVYQEEWENGAYHVVGSTIDTASALKSAAKA